MVRPKKKYQLTRELSDEEVNRFVTVSEYAKAALALVRLIESNDVDATAAYNRLIDYIEDGRVQRGILGYISST